ncbi:MAG: ParB/RepB/Spo0J family partition protein [Candidatus Colwellbacteria bacterium]|jgi:ParB family chromosome partitioning protein|nr:ParB/RepB/Spo0J family partition protein [Candidatus Colwellbacteria bacterium]MCK9497476.1 ParB/RepB/Spo0J family partition protein [Candidatus Colwellbacteria bacterium]MDD3752478.1 ParB/RepB/Spo0J family partition protein [Candidatus Colwellbacteria bacterium]MDD4818732.1 ParB/RepB/Spo0J family partition protein [Candidatus Colwellbacteria bacterium]
MLGKGLESLIPSGGYKKPENSDSTNSSFNQQQENSAVSPSAVPYELREQKFIPERQYQEQSPAESPLIIAEQSSSSEAKPLAGQAGQAYSQAQDSYEPQQPQSPVCLQHEKPDSEPAYPAGGFDAPAENKIYNVNENAQKIRQEENNSEANRPSYLSNQQQEAFSQPRVLPAEDTKSFEKASSVDERLWAGEEMDYSRKQDSVFQIEAEKIFPNPHQPRRHFDEDSLNELANSIREFGIIQPLVVTKMLKETDNGTEVTYQLIAGERRLMAAKKAGLRTVPAIIKKVGMDRERLELAIIENIQRENLNPLEAARSYARLQDDFGLTQREIAIRMGKSRETIANTLRLLNLPSEIQQALEEGKINESHARLLLQIGDISRQKEFFQSILRNKPSVRELKAKIRREKKTAGEDSQSGRINPELMSLQSRLEEVLGTKVKINDEGDGGKITINYYSPEELNAIISRMAGGEYS